MFNVWLTDPFQVPWIPVTPVVVVAAARVHVDDDHKLQVQQHQEHRKELPRHHHGQKRWRWQHIFAVHDLALNFENAKVDFVKFFKNPFSNEILLSLSFSLLQFVKLGLGSLREQKERYTEIERVRNTQTQRD